ncbi:TRAP transporter small permease [Pseudodonghicola flavimaris]|uniref:TRAP transporter small permease protein n=1 Tax=Pseudodonghicola flavimaris TaxID=3050036 RepID=A0ABT7EZN7_9RHOB|nr:TRAP transporter small permease [Pseudodonghicola flavimaris]MDK3017813.1 TRAP transporter small permease [Pseudodonghicola flavimaris]
MRHLERLFVTLNGAAVILLLAGMAGVVGTNVALRYLTNNSLPWADEAARYMMIWMTFVGAGLALRGGMHVAITNLQDSLPKPAQRLLRGLIVLLLLVFFGFMVWVSWQYMQRMQYQKTPALRLSFKYIYAAMPIGFGLLILHLLLIARPFIGAGHYKSHGHETDAMPGGANG